MVLVKEQLKQDEVEINRNEPFSFWGKTFLRFKSIFMQMFRYGVVGGAAAMVDLLGFALSVKELNIDYRISVFIGFTFGTLTNFILCNLFLYERRSLSLLRAGLRHYFSSVGGLVTNELVMIILVEWVHVRYIVLAKVVATGIGFLVNFSFINYYAFNSDIGISKIFRKNKQYEEKIS